MNKNLFIVIIIIISSSCTKKYISSDKYFSNTWRNDKVERIEIDTNIAYKNSHIDYDSVIGFDYVGFMGDSSYYPINNIGQYTSTIINSKKLTTDQINTLISVIAGTTTYQNTPLILCYEPRMGFIYHRNNKVIAQTQVCLSCMRIRSTTINKDSFHGIPINEQAITILDNLRKELGFRSN